MGLSNFRSLPDDIIAGLSSTGGLHVIVAILIIVVMMDLFLFESQSGNLLSKIER